MSDERDKVVERISVGGGAFVAVPISLEWHLRYGNLALVRFEAASVVATFKHLITECTQKEALRRLRLMKKALNP